MQNKKLILLIVFGILIFGLRAVNLNEALYDDESNFAYSVTVMDEFGFNQDYYSAMPQNLIYKPFIWLFGLETWVFRLVVWMFGILNTVMLYIFAKRNWGEKVAFYATLFMLVGFYPTLASLQFDVEGNLVMFSIMLIFFGFLEYEKSDQSIREGRRKAVGWQIVSGIGLGLAVISKYNSVYVVLILALYSLIKRRWNVVGSTRDLFLVYLVGFALFLCYVFLGIVASPEHWLEFIWVRGFSRYYGSSTHFLAGSMYLLWSTLLLFGFYILGWFRRSRENLLLMIWVTIPLLFYTFLLPFGSMDRYFMHTIPALCILGGVCIHEMRFKIKHWYAVGAGSLIAMVAYFVVNNMGYAWTPRFPSLYANELLEGNLHFLFSYTSAAGPTFGVNFATIFWSMFLGGGFLVLFLMFIVRRWKRENRRITATKNENKGSTGIAQWMLVGFLLVGVGFNLFLVGEYLLHPTGVDVSGVKWEMMEYVEQNGELGYPVYSTDSGILWNFDHHYWYNYKNVIGVPDNELAGNLDHVEKRIDEVGGTFILLHWPPLHTQSPALRLTSRCQNKRSFYSQGVLVGEVYGCQKQS